MLIVDFHRFIQCAHQRIHHISNADYDEFVSIVCTARNAFYLAPGGIVQFNELLQSLRRSKSCRKELWQRIVSGLATGTVWQLQRLGRCAVGKLVLLALWWPSHLALTGEPATPFHLPSPRFSVVVLACRGGGVGTGVVCRQPPHPPPPPLPIVV